MNRTLTPAGFALALLLLAGCATPGPTTAEREDVVERTAVVEAIDPNTREVLLRTEDGRPITVIAGREVRNFGQIEVGDTVRAVFAESVAARMAEPDEGGPTTGMMLTERAAEGEAPGAATGMTIQTVVEVLAYDPRSHVATFRMPEGDVHSLVVKPEMRAFAAARQPGDRVAITFTEAFAVVLEPTEG
jgi:hypothetical protein